MSILSAPVAEWLEKNALDLDTSPAQAARILPVLAEGGVFGIGVPAEDGGTGGDVTDSVETIAAVSARSLAAGFVLWGHRSYIEYLLQSPNQALRSALLPRLLTGSLAGATGLSNAMKFLSGLEELQITARAAPGGYAAGSFILDGKLPWVTNLRPEGFHVAAAISRADGAGAFIASLASDDAGLVRSKDLDLMALRASNTAAVTVTETAIDPSRIIHPDAAAWLPAVRPAFLGLQCGMSIGLARRALGEAHLCSGGGRHILADSIAAVTQSLAELEKALREGLLNNIFHAKPEALFAIRITFTDLVAQATSLELQATGGKAYLTAPGAAFSRRWREAAFIPIITPSLVQLKAALARHQQSIP